MQDSVDRLRREVELMRAARRRLVQDGDDARRWIERELHDGPQQDLAGVAVALQHARRLVDDDPAAAGALLDGLRRTVSEALDRLERLAHRTYPPLLEGGGLRVALRSAAAAAGVPVALDVPADIHYPPPVAATVYFCCVEALACAGDAGKPSIAIRVEGGMLLFDVCGLAEADIDGQLSSMRDRVEALDGQLTIASEPGAGTRISGRLPIEGNA